MKSEKKPRFILSRRNQKGQVAVFVALIFQVVFVFFAMLINVGLLVHHKINLQQSTDLAAYYGAMKQAEILNVMAHVNYQIRQAWKLFTWRYRVLGTFGMERESKPANNINPTIAPIMPTAWQEYKMQIEFNKNSGTLKCVGNGADRMNFTDTPFLCMGHNGFKDWFANEGTGETFCKINCKMMDNASTSIKSLSGVGSFSWGGANIGSAVNTAITKTNGILKDRCEKMGPVSLATMGLFYSNYYFDTDNRKRIIKVLNNNLSQTENDLLDLDGKKVLTGVENTLKNNLTEANKSSLTPTSIITYNGAKNTEKNGQLISEITFQYLNFFLLQCKCKDSTCSPDISIQNFGDDSTGAFGPNSQVGIKFEEQYTAIAAQVKDLFAKNSAEINTLGFEKNPWYNVYYGVKATSEPRIPFLPLTKIKLNAISFAKPFGGTLGPWYYKTWSNGSDKSSKGDWEQGRTDYNLPARTAEEAGFQSELVNKLKDSIKITPNFSLYIDDKLGLRNHKYLGIYQGMLNAKIIPNSSPGQNTKISADTKILDQKSSIKLKPNSWPSMSEWSHLSKTPNDSDYDPLAINIDANGSSAKNTYTRDLEVSVVAPNQFDVSYYSIEPNFYQAYGKNILVEDGSGQFKSGFREMANKAGEDASKLAFPYDFGSTVNDKIAQITREFSVSRQLQVVAELFAANSGDISKIGVKNLDSASDMFFTFIPRNPAATLTGWTYNDPRKYNEFPAPSDETIPYTMQFGSCNDKRTGSGNEKIYASLPEEDKNQPAAPGNCVTGGRTGYSVKLISSDMVRVKTKHKDLGGPGTGSAPIANPVDENFLKF